MQKTFPTERFGEKPDYSEFDRHGWTSRSSETHGHHAFQHKTCQTRSDQVDIDIQYYSDCYILILFHIYVIDPMSATIEQCAN